MVRSWVSGFGFGLGVGFRHAALGWWGEVASGLRFKVAEEAPHKYIRKCSVTTMRRVSGYGFRLSTGSSQWDQEKKGVSGSGEKLRTSTSKSPWSQPRDIPSTPSAASFAATPSLRGGVRYFVGQIHGYLAHKKQRPPRTLQ